MDATGKLREMSEFKGQVLLIANTATKCGFTPQHLKEFRELKEKYGAEGFEVRELDGKTPLTAFHTCIHRLE